MTATLQTVERAAALGDSVLVDIRGTVGEETIMDNHDWQLTLRGEGGWLPGFDEAFVGLLNQVLRTLREAPMPTIAAVEGFCLGAGSQLAVACDLRTATAEATFGVPAAKLGLLVDQWTVRRVASARSPA